MEHSEIVKNSSEKFKTQMKNSKVKQKNSSKKLKVSANPLGLLAENTSKKKADLTLYPNQPSLNIYCAAWLRNMRKGRKADSALLGNCLLLQTHIHVNNVVFSNGATG